MRGMLLGMATLAQKIQAEAKIRDLIADSGLQEPDAVEYGATCIRLLWREPKLCLVIDIDAPPEGWEAEDEAGSDSGGEPFDGRVR